MPPESNPRNDDEPASGFAERLYYQLIDGAPDALVTVNANGKIHLVNAQTESMFGYERGELIGEPIEILMPQRFRDAHVSHRSGFVTTPRVRGMGAGLELHGRRKDGTEFPVEISLSPLQTEQGLLVCSAIRDVSERKKAEMATLLLAAIVDSSDDAIISTTLDGVITSWNRGAERVFGYAAREVLGKLITILSQPGGEHEHTTPLERLKAGQHVEQFEALRRRKDGREIQVSVTISAVRDARGKLLGASKMARDITEQKRVQASAALATERLLSAIESTQGMFALFDAEDNVVLCNSDFRRFFGGSAAGAMVGRGFSELVEASLSLGMFELGELSVAAFRDAWLTYHRNPTGMLDLRTTEGHTLRVADRPTAEGGVVTTIWDVTDDVMAAQELRKAQLAAEAASTAKSEFLSSMSHELRTPLNAILGFAQLLQRDKKTPLTDRQRDKVSHILKGGEHLLRLIDDVLDLSRIEAGGVTISLEPVSVASVLGEVQATLEPMATRAESRLVVDPVPERLARVVADRTRFAQVLMNYGSNAIKYGRPGGTIRFVVSEAEHHAARISVVDQGEGISPDKHDKIFQPFQRAGQEFGAIEGTGIGLTICKRLAEIMGGQVGFHSESAVGSQFWIELPIEREAGAASEASHAGSDVSPASRGESERLHTIIYVEDNPSNIAFMRDLIEDFGHVELITAPNAEIGIELVRAHRPDAVIMDINLPGMSGVDATRCLREWPETKDIPVIALTAAAMIRDAQRADMSIFDRYLTKPVKVDELTRTLEAFLQKA